MFDSIISIFNRNNKISELKDLKARGDLSTDEFSTMKNLVMYGTGDSIEFDYFKRWEFSSLESSLKDFWEGKKSSEDYFAERHRRSGISRSIRISAIPSRPIIKTEEIPKTVEKEKKNWGFKITKDFMKSINKLDKKLQGRILEAITKITLSPKTVMGDTIKPLTSDLEGYWRYRIGDYRLIYKPIEKWNEILLISFKARGSAYH